MKQSTEFLNPEFIYPQLKEGWKSYAEEEFEFLVEMQFGLMKALSEGCSFEECYKMLTEQADNQSFHTCVKHAAYFSKNRGLEFAYWLKDVEPGYQNNEKYSLFLDEIKERNAIFDAQLAEGKIE